MNVARYLVQGCDVWLNNPRRPLEASGTSGMKAAVNGVLNLSVLDGWWVEGYRPGLGWAIGHGEEYADPSYQDQVEARTVYDLLEKEVVPLFYERGPDGLPRGWIAMMKGAIRELGAGLQHQPHGARVHRALLPPRGPPLHPPRGPATGAPPGPWRPGRGASPPPGGTCACWTCRPPWPTPRWGWSSPCGPTCTWAPCAPRTSPCSSTTARSTPRATSWGARPWRWPSSSPASPRGGGRGGRGGRDRLHPRAGRRPGGRPGAGSLRLPRGHPLHQQRPARLQRAGAPPPPRPPPHLPARSDHLGRLTPPLGARPGGPRARGALWGPRRAAPASQV